MKLRDLTTADVAVIKRRLLDGHLQHDIAADYKINQGRINDIAKNRRFSEVPPAPPGPAA